LINEASDEHKCPSGGKESEEKKFGFLRIKGKFEARKVSEGVL
jgi:hypothetical protein